MGKIKRYVVRDGDDFDVYDGVGKNILHKRRIILKTPKNENEPLSRENCKIEIALEIWVQE